MNRTTLFRLTPLVAAAALAVAAVPSLASSHREAPFITSSPKVDGTDFYMFRSYETGRSAYTTLIANYQPLQDAYGGPNYFSMDPRALYEIHVDNNGDAKEDLSFQFQFTNTLANGGRGLELMPGKKSVAIPLIQAGPVANVNDANLNVAQTFTVTMIRGDRRKGEPWTITNADTGSAVFDKPVDNIGTKTIADYAGYAAKHVYNINIPNCATPGRLFVGQRREGFAVNLGVVFDLVNAPLAVITDPTLIGAVPNVIGDANVTSLAMEMPTACLTNGTEPVIGGWTTASLRQTRNLDATPRSGLNKVDKSTGDWVQVSRLGMPLVNEVVIGLKDKDKFNASLPSGDGQFLTYVTNPTLPKLLEIALALPNSAPTNYPRSDLTTTFLTGIPGLNQPAGVVASEMLRLNTSIAPVPFAQQNRLGIVGNILAGGNDSAGYPNGRRPKDDVVDISLVAMMGGLCMANGDGNVLGLGEKCKPSRVPLGATSFSLHDAVDQAVTPFLPGFPYLNTPTPGAQ
ncbi:MAG: DUF4331 domain-containing protein [Vitreoscilla sp.]|nr:DUF4331 domain-containing protein [Vitreoscilla sp.]